MTDAPSEIIPRQTLEGFIPLFSFEGDAHECGLEYTTTMLEKYPHYTRYFHQTRQQWAKPDRNIIKLFEKHAPHVIELYSAILEALKNIDLPPSSTTPPEQCTSFGVDPELTLDNIPISGQTKDTGIDSIPLYMVLRMRIKDAPSILVLAYPGEILGYGFWSTGMSIFRNSLHSSAGSPSGLTMEQWGLLALAQNNIQDAIELALKHGIKDTGNILISDKTGASASVEFNVAGVNVIESQNGISTHTNHPVGPDTSKYEKYPDPLEQQNSRFRMTRLRELIESERVRLTAQKAFSLLANHDGYPRGICRHRIGQKTTSCTTAAVIAEPTKGLLHCSRGNPCANWPRSYCMSDH
jgi:isopenicillin-N N-acyltransferase like protein